MNSSTLITSDHHGVICKIFEKNWFSPLGVVMYTIFRQNTSHRHKQLIFCEIMRHMIKFSCFCRKLSFWPLKTQIVIKIDGLNKFQYILDFWNQLEKCFKMIYNMLYIKLNLTSMISEVIGRFFPDRRF